MHLICMCSFLQGTVAALLHCFQSYILVLVHPLSFFFLFGNDFFLSWLGAQHAFSSELHFSEERIGKFKGQVPAAFHRLGFQHNDADMLDRRVVGQQDSFKKRLL
ncbi:hypothetical protein BS78_02G290300 [Paspalum vaginatum]|nr:hypothetical protein BS78_02G290300 [Paspalum vaginatum]